MRWKTLRLIYLDERRDAPGQEAYIFVAAGNDGEQVLMAIHTSTNLMEESLELPSLRLAPVALQLRVDRGRSLKDSAQRRRPIFNLETMSFGESFDELSVRFGQVASLGFKQQVFGAITHVAGIMSQISLVVCYTLTYLDSLSKIGSKSASHCSSKVGSLC